MYLWLSRKQKDTAIIFRGLLPTVIEVKEIEPVGCYKYVLIAKHCLKTQTEPICTDATAAAPVFPVENDHIFFIFFYYSMDPMQDDLAFSEFGLIRVSVWSLQLELLWACLKIRLEWDRQLKVNGIKIVTYYCLCRSLHWRKKTLFVMSALASIRELAYLIITISVSERFRSPHFHIDQISTK